jgi:transposase
LIDESGMLMAPLVRRSLAPAGRTPIIKQKGSHRDKVSLIAALCVSPQRRQRSLYTRTYPKQYVNHERAADFLHSVLKHLRGRVMVIWDRGNMHRGPAIRELQARFPRLELHSLPPYAPELNPVEQLWNHLKCDRFVNHAPTDVWSLDRDVRKYFGQVRSNSLRLRSFLSAADLPFD